MIAVPLKRIAELRVDRQRNDVDAILTLDLIEGGTGRLLTDPWEAAAEPPAAGVADVRQGDVLFGKLRPYLAKVVHTPRRAYASTELMCLRPRKGIDSRWFFYRMMSGPTVEWAVATSEGTKMPRTSWEGLGTFRVTVPPLDQQRVIADYLDTETARIDALLTAKRTLRGLIEERWIGLLRHLIRPVDAPLVRLRHVAALKRGQSPRPIDNPVWFDERGSHGWVRIEDVSRSDMYLSSTRDRLSAAGQLRSVPVGPGVLLVSISASVGKPIITAMDCCYHDGFVGMHDLQAVTEYVYFWLLLPETLAGLGQVGTQSNINSDILGDVAIALPPRDQQKKTVDLCVSYRRVVGQICAALHQQVVLLQARRQALITAAVTGELDASRVA